MPYDPNHCTHHDAPMRQQLFACLTCRAKDKQDNGICYSCSIQCHSNHELVELFARRGFSCDCGTTRMASFGACNLRKNFDGLDTPEETNKYNHNFSGRFCSCDQVYDPSSEQGIMFQCLLGDACDEEWFHEECILGVDRLGTVETEANPESTSVKDDAIDDTALKSHYPQGVNMYDLLEPAESSVVKAPEEIKEEQEKSEQNQDGNLAVNNEEDDEDEEGDEDDEDDTLDGLPRQEDIGAFICWKCVEKNPILLKWGKSWPEVAHEPVVHGIFKTIEERELSIKSLKPEPSNRDVEKNEFDKRALDDGVSSIQPLKKIKSDEQKQEVSLFLKPGFHDHVKASSDPDIKAFAEKFPFLLEEESVYEPPQDDDANSSLLDAGTRALNSIPRDQAINGMQAYSMIRERLSLFLRPFAEQGKVVTEHDVTNFFEEVRNEK
ncbi:hypothetical protein AWJ20_2006 [Sugiyamaella lignohabitans]|uniref:UBR-type domain-containing protein n=1 Tax=Sugiyamaella lignohabitans TaxID=796027 RepID=A0A167ESZ9_9ASCO|nr:uncharacterized protein AWJ20_2006 [Sugiyamaella lignohabitans]ANB14418.1 hypothetical protein AWJ20_2006 [Sugiyamaella lignohabitans]